MGDGAQLGHASSLHAGQSVPGGERRHGFSAQQRTEVDYRGVDPVALRHLREGRLLRRAAPGRPGAAAAAGGRRRGHADRRGARSSPRFGTRGPWPSRAGRSTARRWPSPSRSSSAPCSSASSSWSPCPACSTSSSSRTGPIRLYGFHYAVHRAIERMTNVAFFPRLLGDSSYIVPYLRWLGYDLSAVEQTGSNFGLEVKHENPFLCTVGSGTMVADGLSMVNADFSSTSFRVSRATIGPRNFLGNYVVYPPHGRTGDNCLVATKAMVPLDGEVRERHRAPRLPQLRDPAIGPARQQVRPPAARGRAAPPPRLQEQAQCRDHRPLPAGVVGLLVRGHRARLDRDGPLRLGRRDRRSRWPVPSSSCCASSISVLSSACPRCSAISIPCTARSTSRTSGAMSASGS